MLALFTIVRLFPRFPASLLALASLCAVAASAPAQEIRREPAIANFTLKPQLAQTPGAARPKARKSGPRAQVQLSKPGPWGQIEYFTTQLEVPLDFLKLWEVPSFSLDWHFADLSTTQVEAIFRSQALPDAIRDDLLSPSKWRSDDSGVIVSPSAATVENLPTAARTAIYEVLARIPENRFQFEPVIIPGGDLEAWLGRDTLRPEILALIQKTLHRRGKVSVFSDMALVLRAALSDEERLAIRKVLSRAATLVCKVHVGPDVDARALADYWSAGHRFKEITPFFESMVDTEGVDKVDLMQLLPASVRKLLYTFPNETHGLAGYFPDCHWTSLNFFNYDPLQRLAEPPMATAYTIENFTEVPKADRLGDVLFFMDKAKGNAYHSCVYIADDIVYTKNGRSRLSPWVLMKLEDVRELYGIYQEMVTVAYRRKAMQ